MSAKEEQQLKQLLGLMARSMTHMTASITAMAFEQLQSQDATVQRSARRMIERMQAISEELYKAAAANAQAGQPGEGSAGPGPEASADAPKKDADVVDAEFEMVDEDKKK